MTIWQKGLQGQIGVTAYKPYEDFSYSTAFPATPARRNLLEADVHVLRVVRMVCSDEEQMVHRIKRRAIRENRVDDANEHIIRRRFAVYNEQSKPVLEYYPKEMIFEVDAMRSPAEVLRQILDVLIPVQNEHFRASAHEH